jgi:hypothetical protein
MFSVITPAANKKLTTVDAVKTELGITGNAEDDKIGRLIDRMSSMIARYVGVPAANDGSATLAEETLEQPFRESPWLRGGRRSVVLARKPVTGIVSIKIGDAEIDADGYELDGAAGILSRVGGYSSSLSVTAGLRTVITFKAGWTLPPAANSTLPPDIEGAVIGLIRSARFAADRDPAVKSEWTTDIERIDYWVGQIGQNGAFPPDIASALDPYCYEPEM